MSLIKQSTARALPILMVDATDGYSEEPGLTLTILVRKAGSSTWSASAGTTVDRGNGSYEYTPTSGEVDTLGVFEYRATGSGARTFRGAAQVVVELPGAVATIADGAITATTIADGTIDAATFAAGAITATAIAGDAITAAKVAAGTITAAKFAANALDATALDASAASKIATAVAAPGTAAITAAVVAGMAAAPVGSVAGAVGSVTGAVGSVTAGVTLANNAVNSNAIDATAVTEIQAGMATAAALTTVGGNVTTALAGLVAINADTDDLQVRAADIQARIPAAAPSAAAVSAQVAADLATAHGAGSWEAGSGGATAGEIADAVWDEALAGHATAGTLGAAISTLIAGVAALPAAAAVVAAIMSEVVGGSGGGAYTFRQVLKRAHAFVAGSGTRQAGDGAYSFLDTDGSTVMVAGTRSGTTVSVTTRGG